MAVACLEASPVVLSRMSPLGAIAVAVAGGKVVAVVFGHSSEAAARTSVLQRTAMASTNGGPNEAGDDEVLAATVLERLVRYAEGEPVEFNDITVAVDHLSPFQRRVVKACRAIRSGERRTYGQLAAKAGSPGAARAVGQVMAGNRTPLIVPCHRVVASGGGLGGFSAPQGLAMKRRLLAMEGELAAAGC